MRECDVLVMCAAVSDYKPATVDAAENEEAKNSVLARIDSDARHSRFARRSKIARYLVVGFAAETHDLEANAQKKLREKNCDMIVANDVSRADSGMESDENEVTIFFRNGESKKISRASKKIYRARARKNNFKDVEKNV